MSIPGLVPSAGSWRRYRSLVPIGLMLAMLSACSPPATRDCAVDCPAATLPEQPRPGAGAADSDAARLEQLESKIAGQRQQIMRLELRMLAKQSEIQALSSAEREAVQEVVRTKAKLRSLTSKAEVVANLAEVKLALQGVTGDGGGKVRSERLAQAQQYADMSELALEEGNVDGAAYLIGQATSYLRTPDKQGGAVSVGDDELRSFVVPVPMTLKRRANVRSGAGTDSDVLTTLNAETTVAAIAYAGLWVRITFDEQATGWIHYGLLESHP